MLTTTPTLALEGEGDGIFVVGARRRRPVLMFFDDHDAVMYRKSDTTRLSASIPQDLPGPGLAAGIPAGTPGLFIGNRRPADGSSLIPSRTTHRPLTTPAGAPPEEMTP